MTRAVKEKAATVLERVGGPGHWVSIVRRKGSPSLYLRWWSPPIGNYVWTSLEHAELERARERAREEAAGLLQADAVAKGAPVLLGYLMARYEVEVTPTKGAQARKEDKRRKEMWLAHLGVDFNPLELTSTHLKSFEAERRRGTLQVEKRKLRAVRNRAIQADEAFLTAVFNWAASIEAGVRLLPFNPMRGYRKPRELNPKQPRTSYDVFLELQKVADDVDPQKLFGGYLALLEALGWRAGAICALQGCDLDLRRLAKVAPHGRILKREETDKVGIEQWVPLSEDARAAVDQILAVNPVAGKRPLFPAPKSKKKKAWSRHHARALMLRAYEKAEISIEERVGFHGYRRKWVDERKHLPRTDVADAGAWQSVRTLDIYEHSDQETILAVVSEPRKLRRPEQLDEIETPKGGRTVAGTVARRRA